MPPAPILPTDPQSITEDDLMNLLFSADPVSIPPADVETLDDGGGALPAPAPMVNPILPPQFPRTPVALGSLGGEGQPLDRLHEYNIAMGGIPSKPLEEDVRTFVGSESGIGTGVSSTQLTSESGIASATPSESQDFKTQLEKYREEQKQHAEQRKLIEDMKKMKKIEEEEEKKKK